MSQSDRIKKQENDSVAGFLLMLALHLKRNIVQLKTEHQRLIDSELRLQNWNERLQQEVDKRTRELEKINAALYIRHRAPNYYQLLFRLTNKPAQKFLTSSIKQSQAALPGYIHCL